MEAEDTVIKKLSQIPDELADVSILEAQAIISFEAGMENVIKYLDTRWRQYESAPRGVSRHSFALPEDWRQALRGK